MQFYMSHIFLQTSEKDTHLEETWQVGKIKTLREELLSHILSIKLDKDN
jgi:hypothetical protein